MFALLAVLANAAIAVVPAQEPVMSNISSVFSSTRIPSKCGASGPTSCGISPPTKNKSCCYEHPGGLILQTQFWDTNPSIGPRHSWTIHGLWSILCVPFVRCDGSFSEGCDPNRDYTDIAGLLTAQGAGDTLSYMDEYWVNIDDRKLNERLW
ncbi:hypothetical protein BC826DRAFT_1124583 [Russula brevipes]|nr:hypothetical protein BC826DRAFT_1124583 [Russula brevipes]